MPKQIHRVNTHRDDRQVVLFTKRFAASTRTDPGGIEVVLELEDTLRPNGSQRVKVVKVRRGGGNTTLRSGQAVLSVKNTSAKWVYELKVGQRFDQLTTRSCARSTSACGGTIEAAAGWSEIIEAVGGNYFTAAERQGRGAVAGRPTRRARSATLAPVSASPPTARC